MPLYNPAPASAPTDADYLVGTANANLSSEIPVGTSPGGELGGTWASPTIDATHSGTAHADFLPLAGGTLTGDLLFSTDNTRDIGADGATRPRTAYLGTSALIPALYGGSSSGGNLALSSTTHATKGKLTFGTSAYDEVNNRLGLGTASPTVLLDAVNEALSTPTFAFSSYNDVNVPGSFLFRYAHGSLASPTVVSDGDTIGSLQWSARGNTAFRTIATIRTKIDGSFSGNAIGSRLEFLTETTGAAGASIKWTMDNAGNLLAGTDNSWDIGASGATRPRTGYFGTSGISPLFNATTGFQVNGAAASGNYLRGNGTNFVSAGLSHQDATGLAWSDRTQGADITIPADYGAYVPSDYEIGDGFGLELSDNAILEIG